ncbi:major facilitator superfamily MFS_1 [Beutenbergia cavernae DSM 12333]|uniref:Major facilitator superfamily MFS_1 n=1 Tax=Beutenbergia cavernae (strain ATCC BAA-8 / DSM 12333 / CCUG 43141 / JCM 11478 / NBRC 16432 / NCIMB 13614 / HKI 0122) TaxID=471853 RepID=C5C623_BEUC1|nr:MFS transporter [Beutenbergia cavernae]ACQ82381.1 major facilitator superfamily MFS_1 [Beutenbergia cavernae DSM 12333]
MKKHAGGSGAGRWGVLWAVAAAQLLVVLDGTIVNIALPSADAQLGLGEDTRHWVISAYLLAFGGLLLIGGRVSGAIGHRRAFVIGLLGFAVASFLAGLAWNPAALIGARALQGVFAALLAPAALSVLSLSFPDPRERGRAFGVFAAVGATGSAIGLVLGGLLTEFASWRWCLYINVPIAVGAAVGAVLIPRLAPVPRTGRVDVLGGVLSAAGIAAIVLGISRIETRAGVSPLVLGLLVGGIVLLTAFVLVERRAAQPVLPLSVLTDRARAGSFIAIALMFLAMFGFYLFMSYYTQSQLSYSPIGAGGVLLIHALVALVGSVWIAGKLMGRVPARVLVVSGLLAAAAGLLVLTFLEADSSHVFAVYLLPAMVLTGLGMGLVITPTASTATQGVKGHDIGAASATFNAAQQLGAAIGVALLNTVAVLSSTSYLSDQSATQTEAAIHGYTTALAVGAGTLLAAAVVSAVMIRSRRPDDVSRTERVRVAS